VILRRVVSGTKREGEKTVCHFNKGGSVLLSNFLGTLIQSGDEVNFPSVMLRSPKPINGTGFTSGQRFQKAGWAFAPFICHVT